MKSRIDYSEIDSRYIEYMASSDLVLAPATIPPADFEALSARDRLDKHFVTFTIVNKIGGIDFVSTRRYVSSFVGRYWDMWNDMASNFSSVPSFRTMVEQAIEEE